MLLSNKMWKGLNEQVKFELESSYIYLGMAAWCNDNALPGFAHWMREQAKEEVEHAMKIYGFIESRGNSIELLPIPAPDRKWTDINDVFEKSLAHEQLVTGLINNLVNMAVEEKDHATSIFLQWFVTEQVEEEETFGGILDKLKLLKAGDTPLLFLDAKMAIRKED